MKKKIILGLSAYLVLFLFTGLYIVYVIHTDTEKLYDLIRLHQVEILREHFLIHIKRVQSDIAMKHTRYSRNSERILHDVEGIDGPIHACFACHHAAPVQAGIDDLRETTHRYKDAVGRALTLREVSARHRMEEAAAYRAGEELTAKVRAMIALTNARLGIKTEKALGDIARSKYVLYGLLAAGLLLTMGLATILIRGFTKPVNRLLEATRTLKSGNLDHRVEGLKEEFGELGSSFNEMAGAIQGQMRRMREAERTLEKANRELRHAQQQMVRAETMAALGTLSSGISHQLSTPLGVILNMTQLMKQEAKNNPAMLGDLDVLEYETKQAIKVTRSLLGFTRSLNSVKERVDVNRMVEEIYKIMEFQTAAKAVKLEKTLDPGLGLIYANSGNVRQVFLNIVLNAVQAMPDGGVLQVSTRQHASDGIEGVEIVFRDTGTGIPKEDLENIFQPYFTTKKDGTGLGLAITYGIVHEHNGRIAVESEVGRGTTFRILLPEGTLPEIEA